jgi:hypothetical protein
MSRNTQARSSDRERNVFINCPFDEDYRPCFEALLFIVAASGYTVRCALEDADGASIRFDKLRKLIAESPHTIHDLLPHRAQQGCVATLQHAIRARACHGSEVLWQPQAATQQCAHSGAQGLHSDAYLSDLGGNDPASHNGDPLQLMAAVTRFLHASPTGKVLAGPKSVFVRFTRFKEGLQTMAGALQRDLHEIHPFREYRVYLALLNEFLRNEQEAGV